MSEFIHRAGISYKINQDLPYGVLFLSLTQRSDLPSCSYPPTINHLSWITKGTRWVILADSVKNPSPPNKTNAVIRCYQQSTHISLSHTEDNTYFPRFPSTTNRTILVPHISKTFKNSGQTNDCGSLRTQVLWEVLELTTSKFWVFSLSPHRDLQHTLFLVQWEEKGIITQSYYE